VNAVRRGQNYLRRALALGVFGFTLLGYGVHRLFFRDELLLVPLLFGTLFLVVALANARIYTGQLDQRDPKTSADRP